MSSHNNNHDHVEILVESIIEVAEQTATAIAVSSLPLLPERCDHLINDDPADDCVAQNNNRPENVQVLAATTAVTAEDGNANEALGTGKNISFGTGGGSSGQETRTLPVSDGHDQGQGQGSNGGGGTGADSCMTPSRNQRQRLLMQNSTRPLEFQKNYPIQRFYRKWRRQEVQGFCSVCVEILVLLTIVILSMYGLGYMTLADEEGHVPATFSWHTLREFFIYQDFTDKECFNYNREIRFKRSPSRSPQSHQPQGQGQGQASSSSIDMSLDMDYAILDSFAHDELQKDSMGPQTSQNRLDCDYRMYAKSTTWLVRILIANSMAILNVITSSIFLLSLSVRRRKGFQIVLLIPSFLCFFLSIFQVMPLLFNHNYVPMSLKDNIHSAMEDSEPSNYMNPMIEETQLLFHCCGVDHPGEWYNIHENKRNKPKFIPASCCNTTEYPGCGAGSTAGVIPMEQAWFMGCASVEFARIQLFEKWGLLLYVIKIMAEVAMFVSLSDLTRFHYPPPEVVENSRCEYNGYDFKCRGVLRVKGVTKDGRVVVDSKLLMPWRLQTSRTDLLNGIQIQVRSEINKVKGSVEVIRKTDLDNFLHEDIYVDLRRKRRGIFVFSVA